MRTGGQIIIDQLQAEGIRHLFMVPGESFLGLLDAIHGASGVAAITARNEAGAAMMAEATGKLTGKPGIAVVTRGPGAANALAGLYIAAQDQTPMVLLVGLPPRCKIGLPAFQHIDLTRVYGSVAKHIAVADSAQTLSQRLGMALRAATSGRPGPAVLGLPEDVLRDTARTPVARVIAPDPAAPLEGDIDRICHLIEAAEKPLVISGSPLWSTKASQDLAAFAANWNVPVAAAFRRQDRMDNASPHFAGHLGFAPHAQLAQALDEADVVLVLGSCLGDVTTAGFSRPIPQAQAQTLVLIAADADRIDPPYTPDTIAVACPALAIAALAGRRPSTAMPPMRDAWRRQLRSAFEAAAAPLPPPSGRDTPAALDAIFAHLARKLGDTAVVCSGAGNYAAALHRHYTYPAYPGQAAPISGSMGYGLPAAIAAKLAYPARRAVAVAGDGCFQMTMQELATAVQHEVPVLVIIANNSSLGTIRAAQMQGSPPRIVATTLVNPDFTALGEAMGVRSWRVTRTQDFAGVLEEALTTQGSALIEIVLPA